jgi:hypothetical protein
VTPEPQDLDHAFLLKDLVHEPVLDVDAAGKGAGKVADQPFVGRRVAEGVFGDEVQQFRRFRL